MATFAQHFYTECQRLAPLFGAAVEADKDFHAARKEGFVKLRAGRYKEADRCRETLTRFRETTRAVDQIVLAAFNETKSGDHTHLPTLFAYLALPGRYSRSGHQRAAIWRFLKRLSLDEEQSGILRGIVVHEVEAAGHEFAEIVRTARKINSPALRENVQGVLFHAQKAYVVARANRLLSVLRPDST